MSYANVQGKEALIEKFRNSTVLEEEESFRPKVFYSSGPMKGQEEPFPTSYKKIRRVAEKKSKESSYHMY